MFIYTNKYQKKVQEKIKKILERKRMVWFQDYGLMILIICMVGIGIVWYNK